MAEDGSKIDTARYHGRVYVPLFPLQTVLFPQQAMPLYVFEGRYKQLIRHCLETSSSFGVVRINKGTEVGMDWTPDQVDRLACVGTLSRLEQVNEQPDGAFYVVARGLDRFRIRRLVDDEPWPGAQVEVLPTDAIGDPCPLLRHRLLNAVKPWMRLTRMTDEEMASVEDLPAPELAAFAVSLLPEHATTYQQALELNNLNDQIKTITCLLEHEMALTTRFHAVKLAKIPVPCGCQLN